MNKAIKRSREPGRGFPRTFAIEPWRRQRRPLGRITRSEVVDFTDRDECVFVVYAGTLIEGTPPNTGG